MTGAAVIASGLLVALAAGCSSPSPPQPEGQVRSGPVAQPEPAVRDQAAPDAAAAGGPDQPVVSWGGVSVFGSDSFTIRPDGAIRVVRAVPGRPETVKTGAVTAAELGALRDRLKAAGCCALRSQRTIGVPDEGHTTLELGFPDLACSVSLWDNEWHQLAAAARCAELLAPLQRRAR